jgi:hypothetical protein
MSGVYLLPVRTQYAVQRMQIERDRAERHRRIVQEVDLARARNEMDLCADCGAELGIRVRMTWDPSTMIFRCLDCGGKRNDD